jgi:hypothetical protein
LTKSTASRKIISIFLSTILVIGTITAFFPSISMTQVHAALSEYDGMMMNYDNNYKSKYSSFKKDNIECNNFNLNLNGLNVDAIPESLSNLLQAQAETEDANIDTSTFGNGAEKLGYKDKDFSFVCINNNDNEFIVTPTPPVPPVPPIPINNLCTVWQDSTPGNNEIFFSVSHDDGETFSTPPQNISKNTGASQLPQMTCEGNNVYVVWQDTTDGNVDIFFARSTNGGQTFSTPDNLSENTGISLNPQISSEGNNVYVVWSDNTSIPGGNNEIFFARSTNGGQTFSTPDNISENTGNSAGPQISSEGNNVYVVWNDSTPLTNVDIFFARSINGGQTFSTPDNISENTGGSSSPRISSEGNNVYVVWDDNTPGNFEVFFARSINGGATFSTADNLSEEDGNESSSPRISSEGNNVYVVWTDFAPDFSTSEILFARSTDGGATFSSPLDNISENTGLSSDPQISSEGNNVYVVWRDIDIISGNDIIFFSFSHDNGQTFSTPDNISENTGVSGVPQISSEGNNVYVIWPAPAPSTSDIFFSFSHDNGQTFSSPPDNLSENTGVSEAPQISSTTS